MFQTDPPTCDVTLEDVRDALHACRGMVRLEHRRDYCATVGIDYARAEEYFEAVCALEAALPPPEPPPAARLLAALAALARGAWRSVAAARWAALLVLHWLLAGGAGTGGRAARDGPVGRCAAHHADL